MKFKGASLSSKPNLVLVLVTMRHYTLRHCEHILRGSLCQLGDHPATKESGKDINNNNNMSLVFLFIFIEIQKYLPK